MSLFETLTDQSWRIAIARSRAEPNLVLQKIMKSSTYRIRLSNNKTTDISAQNAGEAIEQALIANRGHTVVECYSGLKKSDVEFIRSTSDKKAMEGYIEHEIPQHEAISQSEVFTRQRRTDSTEPLFNDAQITQESILAKSKFRGYGMT